MTQKTGGSTKFVCALSTTVLLLASAGWAAAQTSGQSTDQTTSKPVAQTSDQSTDQTSKKDESDIQKRIENAATVLNEIMATKDKAIPDKVMSDAMCVAVVPSMIKIAIGFGGNHGKGVATCRTATGWSAPAPFSIAGGSWGLQIGGQAIDLVMLVMNQKGMDALLSSKFKVGADASAAAGPVGRQSEASTDWKLKAEVLTYSRARGIFAGIDLSGARVSQDKDETRVLYGKMIPFATVLSGKVNPPDGSEPFLAAVRKYAQQAREQGSVTTTPPNPGASK